MTLLIAFWLVVASGAAPELGNADTVRESERGCPAAERNSAVRVQNVLGSPLIAEMRKHVDLGTASLDDIQLLRNPEHREICEALWNALREGETPLRSADAVSFYRSGDRYFVPIARRPPPGVVRLGGPSSLNVYDMNYQLIARLRA
jgi:hypothetical protein